MVQRHLELRKGTGNNGVETEIDRESGDARGCPTCRTIISTMVCPKCGAAQPEFAVECASCGIVFSKWGRRENNTSPGGQQFHEEELRPAPAPATARNFEDIDAVTDGRIGRRELMILVPGLIAAIIVYSLPFLRFVISAMVTLFHEFGHAVAGWLLGHPSLPAFDFVYGGGITPRGEFRVSIAVAIAGAFAYAGWRYRRNRRTLAVLASAFLPWLFIVSSEWRREMVIAAAGHTTELILAAIFFYMALANVGWRIPEVERPLGAFVAFFVTINSIMFALRLRNDPDYLAWYGEGKGGALMNDLESIALDMRIHFNAVHVTIGTVAGWLILFSFIPFGIALLWYFYRSHCHRIVGSLLQPQPQG